MDHAILIAQKHSWENDRRLIRDVLPFFRDNRYIRIDGRPLFIVYRPRLLPDTLATMNRWRQECRAAGIGEIFLAGVMSFGFDDPIPAGLHAMIEFPPHDTHVWPLSPGRLSATPGFAGTAFDYLQARRHMLCFNSTEPLRFKGVMPCWDNTARRSERATFFINSSPGAYYNWLKEAISMTASCHRGDRRLVFINAWNEWGEGAPSLGRVQ